MNILSLDDGMACGHIAFMLEEIPIDRYVAYEIDGYMLLGNGWTIETIRHLIRCAVKDGERND